MPDYDNTNRGVLFRNTNKKTDNHPDFNGSINVDGKDFWLSGWTKEGNGKKFFSLSVKPKEENKAAENTAQIDDLGDDSIPFNFLLPLFLTALTMVCVA